MSLLLTVITIALSNCAKSHTAETTTPGSTVQNINKSQFKGYKFNIGPEICLASINQSFNNYKEKEKFPYSIWITVETKNTNPIGGPTDDEGNLFNIIEDSIIKKFAHSTPFCFIGRTQRYGYREIMMYATNKDKAAKTLDALIKKAKFNRKIEYKIDLDSKWENVSGFLE